MKRFVAFAALLLLCAPHAVSALSDAGYVSRLEAMRGTSYWNASCSGYICIAKRHAPCSAIQMWDGCGGALALVQEFASLSQVNRAALIPGDVIDFRGVHVAVYAGHGEIMDSVPERGVGTLSPSETKDSWYSGSVRILRWKNSQGGK